MKIEAIYTKGKKEEEVTVVSTSEGDFEMSGGFDSSFDNPSVRFNGEDLKDIDIATSAISSLAKSKVDGSHIATGKMVKYCVYVLSDISANIIMEFK